MNNDQRSGEHFGWVYNTSDSAVFRPLSESDGCVIFMEDGQLEPIFVEDAMNHIVEAEKQLWDFLGPLEIDGTEIAETTELYDLQRGCELSARSIDVDENERQPYLLFYIKDTDPEQFVRYSGEQLRDRMKRGVIKSKKDMHAEATEESL